MALMAVADRPIDESHGDAAVFHGLHIGFLEVHGDRPEYDVHRLDHVQHGFGQVEHGFFATAAGSAPIECDFRLAHWVTSVSVWRGPSGRIFSTMSVTTVRRRSPSDADIHSRRNRSSSIPISLTMRRSSSKRRRHL